MDAGFLAKMKRGAILCNTSRGKLVETQAALDALDSGQLGGLVLDVYEREKDFFFRDLSAGGAPPDAIMDRLLAHPKALLTGHQAFLTEEGETARH